MSDELKQALIAELASGPIEREELLVRLDKTGLLDQLESSGGGLADDFDEFLLELDEIWMTEDDIVASTAVILDGACFSHVVTPQELSRGVLHVTPDLVAADMADPEGIEMEGGGQVELAFSNDGADGLEENGSLEGPAGWLNPCAAGDRVMLRLRGSAISVEVPNAFGDGEAEAQGLSASVARLDNGRVAIEITEVVMDAIVHDPSLFRNPVPPIGELLPDDLEWTGAWISRQGDDAKPPGVDDYERALDEISARFGLDRCCDLEFKVVRQAWVEYLVSSSVQSAEGVLRSLGHGFVAAAFAVFALELTGASFESLSGFVEALGPARGRSSAPLLYLNAMTFEAWGMTLEAEGSLRLAILADAAYEPALADLAWFEADRGNAQAAASLLARLPDGSGPLELGYLDRFLPLDSPGVGRNDPCPCGSGAKFKLCCINGPTLGLKEHADWLFHKVIAFALRPQRRGPLDHMISWVMEEVDPSQINTAIPPLLDVVAFDEEAFDEFIEHRGPLLPDIELAIAESWRETHPALYQVVATEPGEGVTLFDTRTAEAVEVVERAASHDLKVGEYLYARVLPAETLKIFAGAPVLISAVHRKATLALLDDGDPDQWDVALWVARLVAPPQVVTTEGEEIILCRLVFRPTKRSWAELVNGLSRLFGDDDEECWKEVVEIDGSPTIRCLLHREDEVLVVETNAIERAVRIEAQLLAEFDDLELLTSERQSVEDAMENMAPLQLLGGQGSSESDEMAEIAAQLIREKEVAWIDESIPALGGLTPREAADDPTRREDLLALLVEFERRDLPGTGFMSFNAKRIRTLLGLAEPD